MIYAEYILYGIPSLYRCSIHHMDEHLGTLDMTKKIVTETHSLGGSFYKSRDIRYHKAGGIIKIHYAEIGLKCSEMIVGYLRLCICHS